MKLRPIRLLLGLCLLTPLGLLAQARADPDSPAGARRARRPARPDLQPGRVQGEEVRAVPVARRREGLHDRRALGRHRGRQGYAERQRDRSLRRGDRQSPRPGGGRDARAGRRPTAAGSAGVLLVLRRQEAPDLHEYAQGLAPEHARRLLGPRRRLGQAPEARRGQARIHAHVREVFPGRIARRVRPGQRSLGRGPRERKDHASDLGRRPDDRQRHRGLGLRRGVRGPRRLPLEPQRPGHRVLALRRERHRRILADQRHGHALSRGHALRVPDGRHDELGGQSRRCVRRPAAPRLAGSRCREIRARCTCPGWSTSTSPARSSCSR